jgi:hypothetical protein
MACGTAQIMGAAAHERGPWVWRASKGLLVYNSLPVGVWRMGSKMTTRRRYGSSATRLLVGMRQGSAKPFSIQLYLAFSPLRHLTDPYSLRVHERAACRPFCRWFMLGERQETRSTRVGSLVFAKRDQPGPQLSATPSRPANCCTPQPAHFDRTH